MGNNCPLCRVVRWIVQKNSISDPAKTNESTNANEFTQEPRPSGSQEIQLSKDRCPNTPP